MLPGDVLWIALVGGEESEMTARNYDNTYTINV